MTMSQLDIVKAHFQIKGISVPGQWIDECMQFLREENGNQVTNSCQLNEKAYEQWLLTDLTDLGSCSLPLQLSTLKCTHIKGKFIVQINRIHDIGMSSYKQFQKLKREENENVDVAAEKKFQSSWQPKSSRMLMMELTDGTSVVSGMEYKSIPSISLSTAPGSKISLEGNIEVRRGILFLTENIVHLLGGSVESLSISHSLDNVLRLALGLEETETPAVFNGASFQSIENKKETFDAFSGWKTSQKPSQQIKKEKSSFTINNCTDTKRKLRSPAMIEDDFDDVFDEDIEMVLMEVENEHCINAESNSNLPANKTISARNPNLNISQLKKEHKNLFSQVIKTPISLGESNKDIVAIKTNTQLDKHNVPTVKMEMLNVFDNSSTNNEEPPKMEVINIEDSDDEALLFAAGEFEDEIKSKNPHPNDTSWSPPPTNKYIKLDNGKSATCFHSDTASNTPSYLPFQYLITMPDSVYKKVIYTIKGFVITLTSKLKQENGVHLLTAMLNDGTGSCEVEINDGVIRRMLGMTANELSERIIESRKNKTLRPALSEKLNHFQKRLISMSSLFKLELTPFAKQPTVIEIVSIEESHLNQLKKRMK